MRKIRDILRLRLASGLPIRQINASTEVSIGAVQKLLCRAIELELGWPLPDDLDDVPEPHDVDFSQSYDPVMRGVFLSPLPLTS